MKKEDSHPALTAYDYQIDNLDRQIISLLLQDANRSFSDIAKLLIVSNSTVHVRMKRLKELGVVTGTQLTVDVQKLGFNMTAYIGVILERAGDSYAAAEAVKSIPEVVELYYITGAYNLLVKVVCHDSKHLLWVLKEKLHPIQGVTQTETFVLLGEGIRRPIELE